MKLYGIPNCNTVKKAQDFLKRNEINFEFHDFKKMGVTIELLNEWFEVFGWENVLNKKGLTFKQLSAEEKSKIQDATAARSYLLVKNSAIKRPILEVDGKACSLGFDENTYIELFK
ncbi:MAG: Spx/MgsR family RNA polymerase-binding regulatory protein [Pedobacter sp.]|nr:MAG: Spx/MgsR family RNA polymerase-binding regulatory protein [Pedobacter sp.]